MYWEAVLSYPEGEKKEIWFLLDWIQQQLDVGDSLYCLSWMYDVISTYFASSYQLILLPPACFPLPHILHYLISFNALSCLSPLQDRSASDVPPLHASSLSSLCHSLCLQAPWRGAPADPRVIKQHSYFPSAHRHTTCYNMVWLVSFL